MSHLHFAVVPSLWTGAISLPKTSGLILIRTEKNMQICSFSSRPFARLLSKLPNLIYCNSDGVNLAVTFVQLLLKTVKQKFLLAADRQNVLFSLLLGGRFSAGLHDE